MNEDRTFFFVGISKPASCGVEISVEPQQWVVVILCVREKVTKSDHVFLSVRMKNASSL
jgi:hypothetical protein